MEYLKYKMIKQNGQILSEVVVAIGVIMVVLIGMSSLMSKNTKTIRQNDVKDIAVRLVEGQIREYKYQRDNNSTNYFSGVNSLAKDTFLPCVWAISAPDNLFCWVMYQDNVVGGNGIGVTVKATWTEETENDREVSLSASIMEK